MTTGHRREGINVKARWELHLTNVIVAIRIIGYQRAPTNVISDNVPVQTGSVQTVQLVKSQTLYNAYLAAATRVSTSNKPQMEQNVSGINALVKMEMVQMVRRVRGMGRYIVWIVLVQGF